MAISETRWTACGAYDDDLLCIVSQCILSCVITKMICCVYVCDLLPFAVLNRQVFFTFIDFHVQLGRATHVLMMMLMMSMIDVRQRHYCETLIASHDSQLTAC